MPGIPAFPDETIPTFGMTLGYTRGPMTVDVHLDHSERQSDATLAYRGYERFRVGSTLTYAF